MLLDMNNGERWTENDIKDAGRLLAELDKRQRPVAENATQIADAGDASRKDTGELGGRSGLVRDCAPSAARR
jgi:hypothetical protein